MIASDDVWDAPLQVLWRVLARVRRGGLALITGIEPYELTLDGQVHPPPPLYCAGVPLPHHYIVSPPRTIILCRHRALGRPCV